MVPILVPSSSAHTFRNALPEPHTALTDPFSGKPTLFLAGSFVYGETHGTLAILVSRIGPSIFVWGLPYHLLPRSQFDLWHLFGM
jgi:hypothetical protein